MTDPDSLYTRLEDDGTDIGALRTVGRILALESDIRSQP